MADVIAEQLGVEKDKVTREVLVQHGGHLMVKHAETIWETIWETMEKIWEHETEDTFVEITVERCVERRLKLHKP